nr:adenylosuccinate lyase [Thermoanaerobaculia bacterium]
TETLLMEAVLRGGDRQLLHERLRRLSLEAQAAVAGGAPNPLLDRIAAAPEFGLARAEIARLSAPAAFTGRAAAQVEEYLAEIAEPLLSGLDPAPVEEPRI